MKIELLSTTETESLESLPPDVPPPNIVASGEYKEYPNLCAKIAVPLQELIAIIIDTFPAEWLQERFDPNSQFAEQAWTQQFEISTPYENIEEWFDSFNTMDLSNPDEYIATSEENTDNLWLSLVEARGYKNKDDKDFPKPVPPETWLQILQFAGWTTEGPTGRGH